MARAKTEYTIESTTAEAVRITTAALDAVSPLPDGTATSYQHQ